MSSEPANDRLAEGLAALKCGRPAEAVVHLEEAAMGSRDPRVWTALGTAFWQIGDRTRGLDAFYRAIETAPGDTIARYNLAVALSEEGQTLDALDELDLVLRTDPAHASAIRLMERLKASTLIGSPGAGPALLNPLNRGEPESLSDGPQSSAMRGSRCAVLPAVAPLPDFDQIPWVTIAVIAINCGVFWLMEHAGGSTDRNVMIAYGSQFRPLVLGGQWWRLVTAMFIHAGWEHIFFNMLFFALSARWVEPFYGKVRFALLYMAAGLAGNFMTLLLTSLPTAGASGAVLGVIAARIVMGFKHNTVIPENLKRKFGWWPLFFGLWILNNGFHNPQTNNTAHVVGLMTGLILAAVFAPVHDVYGETDSREVRAGIWAIGALCAYTILGMAWSVHRGVDESSEIARAERDLTRGKITVKLVHYRDPNLGYTLNVPQGWDRQDQRENDEQFHRWVSPMLDASIFFVTFPAPSGQGGEEAFAIEQSLVGSQAMGATDMRTLSKDKLLLSYHVGGKIVREGIDDRRRPRLAYYYFVPINDVLYILVCAVDRYHAPKYAPIFDTIAASFRSK